MKVYYIACILFLLVLGYVRCNTASRVLELSDRFLDLQSEGEMDSPWLVMFYAPWCAYCHRLAPVWAHVAQSLHASPVRVARLDCTRFTSTASHFKIRAYPTIMFIKDSTRHEYKGDQNKDDLMSYALRMAGPTVSLVTKADTMDYIKENTPLFFMYVGSQSGPLWEVFFYLADRYQSLAWFYATSPDVASKQIGLETRHPTVFVYKDNTPFFFSESSLYNDKKHLNVSLHKWLEAERFGTFPKVSRANMKDLMAIDKFLVLAIVEENKLGEMPVHHKEFRDMMEMIIREKKEELHPHFQFGWLGSPELAHSIAMFELSLPHLIVINSTTQHHHLPEDDPSHLTPEAVLIFLQQVYNESALKYGGDGVGVRLFRMYYQARTSLNQMWTGNPVLTALIFGLPMGFLSLIFYSACCTDILDADEDEPEGPESSESNIPIRQYILGGFILLLSLFYNLT